MDIGEIDPVTEALGGIPLTVQKLAERWGSGERRRTACSPHEAQSR